MPNILLREKWSAPKSHLHFDSTDSTVTVAQRYPPDTRAFLYYFMSPEKPRIAGELRLRVASSDDPASFESGSDLLLLNGQPWSRPLYSLSKHYPPLYEKLREDQLVPDDLDTALSTLPSEKFSYRRSHLVYSLNDTFIVDFSTTGLDFHVVTEKGLASLPFEKPFSDYRKMCTGRPYTGAYTNHHLSILIISWICRKCLGAIWTFSSPRPQRHKDRCVTLSQDNHACEVCPSPLRWPYMLSRGRRALPEN